MFGFGVVNVVLSIRINRRSAIAREIYGNVLQSDINLFSLLTCALPLDVTRSQLWMHADTLFISHSG